jgi:hypothetical protein
LSRDGVSVSISPSAGDNGPMSVNGRPQHR